MCLGAILSGSYSIWESIDCRTTHFVFMKTTRCTLNGLAYLQTYFRRLQLSITKCVETCEGMYAGRHALYKKMTCLLLLRSRVYFLKNFLRKFSNSVLFSPPCLISFIHFPVWKRITPTLYIFDYFY